MMMVVVEAICCVQFVSSLFKAIVMISLASRSLLKKRGPSHGRTRLILSPIGQAVERLVSYLVAEIGRGLDQLCSSNP